MNNIKKEDSNLEIIIWGISKYWRNILMAFGIFCVTVYAIVRIFS